MENPFYSNNIRTLKEAFPNVDGPVIDDVLYSVNNDVNQAFELLLSMSDSNKNTAPFQQPQQQQSQRQPQHTLHHSASMPFPVNNSPNRITPARVKPMTVREELAQWRQDLREESRLRANRALNTRSSTSNLSLSNLLQSRNKSTPQVQQRENRYQSPLRERHSIQRLSVPTPLPTNSSSDSSSYSRSTLFSNNSNNQNRPVLPARRSASNHHHFHSTNPFISSSPPDINVQSTRSTPLPPLPARRNPEVQHSFNPFEEENDIPPPAYSEIQRDTIIQSQGHTG